MSDFWLVQRVHRSVHSSPITKLEHLCGDYMGSAEFEFGAVPRACQAMHAKKLTQTAVTVKAFDTETTFHVVAPADQADSLQKRFQAWFDSDLRSKENPRLDRVISRKGWCGEPLSDGDFERLPIAWFALRESIFFSIDEIVAKVWFEAMSSH